MPVGALILGLIVGVLAGACAYFLFGAGALPTLLVVVLTANLTAFLSSLWGSFRK
ncbi:hypothetical protein [Paracoccus lutimaris]|uniref:hypothetical protein n=1 Tax=Paracoccus lutimaris TaxID=1490030 RepID=UPI0015F06D8B|nr:hypothetical protein [Paracoccus lutimaris]